MKNREVLVMFSVIALLACNNFHSVSNKDQILSILKNERLAHLTKNTDLFLSEFSDSTYQISNGEIKKIAKEAFRKQIVEYFNSSKIVNWEDVKPPIIQFSKDQTMAYAVMNKIVVTQPIQNSYNAKIKNDTTVFAWVSIFNKSGNQWKLICNISTKK